MKEIKSETPLLSTKDIQFSLDLKLQGHRTQNISYNLQLSKRPQLICVCLCVCVCVKCCHFQGELGLTSWITKRRKIIALDRQGTQQQRPVLPFGSECWMGSFQWLCLQGTHMAYCPLVSFVPCLYLVHTLPVLFLCLAACVLAYMAPRAPSRLSAKTNLMQVPCLYDVSSCQCCFYLWPSWSIKWCMKLNRDWKAVFHRGPHTQYKDTQRFFASDVEMYKGFCRGDILFTHKQYIKQIQA